MKLVGYVLRLFDRPHAALYLFGAAALLSLPALFGGFALDDHVFRMTFSGAPGLPEVEPSWLGTFHFSDGTPESNLKGIERGSLPWWTDLHWKTSFWRPVSSFTHWIDFVLWRDRAWLMHLHSVALYGLLVVALFGLYKRLLPGAAAVLAAVLFLIDEAHALPVGWLSNRNALLSALFGVLTVTAFDGWRRNGLRWAFPLSVLSFVLALLSGEGAVAVAGYLIAYAVFVDKSSATNRMLSVAPHLVVVIAWRALYNLLGHGAAATTVYADPGGDPLRFAGHVFGRLPLYVYGQYGVAEPMLGGAFPGPLLWAYWIFCIGFIVLLWRVLRPLFRADDTLKFWFAGSVLAAVPICSVLPQSRVLIFVGIGAMPVVARLVLAVRDAVPVRYVWPRWPRFAKGFAYFFVFAHLILAPPLYVASTPGMWPVERLLRHFENSFPSGAEVTEQTVVIVNAPADALTGMMLALRSSMNRPVPKSTWLLASTPQPVQLKRVDEDTLVFSSPKGLYADTPFHVFNRLPSRKIEAGYTVELSGVTFTVLEVTKDDRPKTVQADFAAPLEDERYRWLALAGGRLAPIEPPHTGNTVTYPGTDIVSVIRNAVTNR